MAGIAGLKVGVWDWEGAKDTDKFVWLLRHGAQERTDEPGVWQPGAPLSKEGRGAIGKLAEAFATYFTTVKFAAVASSTLRRARETATILFPTDVIEEAPELGPSSHAAWDYAVKIHPPEEIATVQGFFSKEAGLVVAEGDRFFGFVRQVLWGLQPGEAALLVSHQPLIEACVATATGKWPPELSLGKGEYVVLRFTKDNEFAAWWRPPQ